MLSAQVEYWKLQENKRHNYETEYQGRVALAETGRHNVETENLGWGTLSETARHNVVTEQTNWFNAKENQRHNVAGEQLGWFNATENQRHNLVTESQGSEKLAQGWESTKQGWAQVDVARWNAATNEMNAYTNARNAEINARNSDTMYFNALRGYEELDLQRERNEWEREHDSSRLSTQFLQFNNQRNQTEVNEYSAETQHNLGWANWWQKWALGLSGQFFEAAGDMFSSGF